MNISVKPRLCSVCGKPGIKPNAKYHVRCSWTVFWAKAAEDRMRKNHSVKRPVYECRCGLKVVRLENKIIRAESLNAFELSFLRVGNEVSFDPARHKRHRCRRA